jgi:hypothetical protein
VVNLSLLDALDASVEAAQAAGDLGPTDAAAVTLARRYAAAIDASDEETGEALERLGPKLLAALTALGLPAPRTAATKTVDAPSIDPLAALREKRRAG